MRYWRLLPLVVLLTAPLSAATFNVNTTADTVDVVPGNGSCADAGAACSLRAAIMEANELPGTDTIIIGAGTFFLGIPGANEELAATGDLDITQSVIITGAGQASTIIDGATLDRLFDIWGSTTTVTITGVWIRNGKVTTLPGDGAGVRNFGLLTMKLCTISDNLVEVRGGTNALARGGGLGNHLTMTLDLCSVRANRADAADGTSTNDAYGGGIWNKGVLSVTRSTISSNIARADDATARAFGGGVASDFALGGSAGFKQSTINGNSAESTLDDSNDQSLGGGVWGYVATALTTISGNQTTPSAAGSGTSSGGGVYAISFSGFFSTTITNNTSRTGGGVANPPGTANFTVQWENSVIFGNVATTASLADCDVSGTMRHDGANSNFYGQGCTSGTQIGNAFLGPLQDNGGPTQTHAVLAGSPLIDAGQGPPYTTPNINFSAQCAAVDQRGGERNDGNGDLEVRCDVGAFEFCSVPGVVANAYPNTLNEGDDTTVTIGLPVTGGTGPQWYRNGALIPGATGPTVVLDDVSAPADGGSYQFGVDMNCGMGFQLSHPYDVSIRRVRQDRFLFWRHASTGAVYLWELEGANVVNVRPLPTVADLNWKVVGSGDVDGDGDHDLVWQHETTRQVYIWLVDATVTAVPLPLPPDNQWRVSLVGDFDGDSRIDLLWQRPSGDQVLNYLWLMNGTTVYAAKPLPNTTTHSFFGAGDYDNDGTQDLMRRGVNIGQEATFWRLRIGLLYDGRPIGATADPTQWVVRGMDDTDGDGALEVFWANISNGSSYYWKLNSSAALIGQGLLNGGGYAMVAAGDYNLDGNIDLIWRHPTSGNNYIWFMQGVTAPNQSPLPPVADTQWRIVAPSTKVP